MRANVISIPELEWTTLSRWSSSNSSKQWEYHLSTEAEKEEGEEVGSQQFPFLTVDLKRSFRVTKVSILGGENVADHPLHNIEVRVGAQNRGRTHQVIEENTRFHQIHSLLTGC